MHTLYTQRLRNRRHCNLPDKSGKISTPDSAENNAAQYTSQANNAGFNTG